MRRTYRGTNVRRGASTVFYSGDPRDASSRSLDALLALTQDTETGEPGPPGGDVGAPLKTSVHSIEAVIWRVDDRGHKYKTSAIIKPGQYFQWDGQENIRKENNPLLKAASVLLREHNG